MKTNPKDTVTKRYVRKHLEEALQIAGLMSNVCFNLKRKAKLDNNDREMLDKMQTDWDKARNKLPPWLYKKQKGSGAYG